MSIEIKPISPVTLNLAIKGVSPLIMHAWSDKALKMLRMTAAERRKQPKVARDPETEAMNATYRTESGAFGIPILAFKASLISAAHKDFGIEKTLVRKSIFVDSDDPGGITPIESDEPIIREDIVRVGAGQTDIRYRCQFNNWSAAISVVLDEELLPVKHLANLVNRAGFSVGIMEWRPEKGGEFGRYEIDATQPLEVK